MSDIKTRPVGPIQVHAIRDTVRVPPICDGALGYSVLPHVEITFGEPGGMLYRSIGIASRAEAIATAAALIEAADAIWPAEQGAS